MNDPAEDSWNRLIFLAQPQIASGDVDALSESIRATVSTFVLTIMATVERYQPSNSDMPKYRFREVGVGYSVGIGEDLVVVSSETQRRLGAGLGFLGRQMLKTNEQQIATARMVAKASTIYIFDTPTLLLHQGKHREFITRHFLWLDSRSGRCSTLVWLLNADLGNNKAWTVADRPMVWLPEGTKEDRKIHVDGEQFLLGIPNKQAFALESLPPGKPVPWSPEAKRVAATRTFDTDSLRELATELNQCLQALRQSKGK